MQQVLAGIVRHGRIASAYLFLGPPGAAKKATASEFAEQLGSRGVDLIGLAPEGASLKIEQVRELQQLIRFGPLSSPYLTVIVEQADTLTDQAAGAFLKTLEEPPAGVVFILLVEREDKIPETIHSRCQRVIFNEGAQAWQPGLATTYYQELAELKSKSLLEQLALAARLEKEKERIEELLYDLVFFAQKELRNLRYVRILLETIKQIKKKATLRLALDVACLKMGAAA